MPVQKGFALVLSLFVIGTLTLLLIGFFSLAHTERKIAYSHSAQAFCKNLSESTLNFAIGQLRLATSNLKQTETWASQPGMIRRYDNQSQNMISAFKLYSAQNMMTKKIDFLEDIPKGWTKEQGIWTDINEPIRRDSDGNGIYEDLYYPVVDPRYADGNIIEGFEILESQNANSIQPCPMPVRWLYVLKNGDFVLSKEAGNKALIEEATEENPIVGRVAFWMDDETCKVNINTASEGTFWQMPKTNIKTDVGHDSRQPISNEFQRYPGHPAMISLSPILKNWLGEDPSTYYQLTPRINEGGSNAGRNEVSVNTPAMILDTDRLYSTVDEYFFSPRMQAHEREENHPQLTPKLINALRFLLTSRSKAPETNMFNLPRISLWPLQEKENYRNPVDRLIAFCSSSRKEISSRERIPYYIQRKSVHSLEGRSGVYGSSQSIDEDWSIERNQLLYSYLSRLLDSPVPAYGGRFSQKFGRDTQQIVTQMLDFIRSGVNTYSFGSPTKETSFGYAYSPIIPPNRILEEGGIRFPETHLVPDMIPGEGQIIPLKIGDTQGAGRFITITEAALVIYPTKRSSIPHMLRVPNTNVATEFSLPIEPSDSNAQRGYLRKAEWLYDEMKDANRTVLHAGWKSEKFRAFILLEYFCPSPGFPSWSPYTEIEISGLERFSINGKNLNFPSSAKVLIHTPIPHGPNAGTIEGHGHSTAHLSLFQPLFHSPIDGTSWGQQRIRNFESTDPRTGYAWHSQNDIGIPIRPSIPLQEIEALNPNVPLYAEVKWKKVKNSPDKFGSSLQAIRPYRLHVKDNNDEAIFFQTKFILKTGISFLPDDTSEERERKRKLAESQFEKVIDAQKVSMETELINIDEVQEEEVRAQIQEDISDVTKIIEDLEDNQYPQILSEIADLKQQISILSNRESFREEKKNLSEILQTVEEQEGEISQRISALKRAKENLENIADEELLALFWTNYFIGINGNETPAKLDRITLQNNAGRIELATEKKRFSSEEKNITRKLRITLYAQSRENFKEATLIPTGTGIYKMYRNEIFELEGGKIQITLREPLQSKREIQRIEMRFPDTEIPEPYVYGSKDYETDLSKRTDINDDSNILKFYPGYIWNQDTGSFQTTSVEALTTRIFHSALIRPGDVVRSVEVDVLAAPKGDLRLYALTQKVSETWFKKGGDSNYDDSDSLNGRFAHGLRNGDYWTQRGGFHSSPVPPVVGASNDNADYLQGGANSDNGWYRKFGSITKNWKSLDPYAPEISQFSGKQAVFHPFYRELNYNLAGTLVRLEGEGAEIPEQVINNRFVPAVPRGLREAKTKENRLGDWDNGYGITEDGPFINKPDEGFIQPTQTYYDYNEGKYKHSVGGYFNRGTFTRKTIFLNFTPSRQISSAVAFGSLPRGVKRVLPWETLLFCPNPAGRNTSASNTGTSSDHRGFLNPPDHLLLDLFWMPVSEPYAISQPFATEGKINMNYQIAPFTYIKRRTPLHCLFKSVGLMAIPHKKVIQLHRDVSKKRFVSEIRGIKAKLGETLSNANNEFYYDINVDHIDGTLRGFEKKFERGEIFRSASEICEIFLVPKRRTKNSTAPNPNPDYQNQKDPKNYGYERMADWWKEFKLTGDNTREAPYNLLYPRLTTKSDTYRIHFRVEKIQKNKSQPKIFDGEKDRIVARHRGSALIERSIPPMKILPDFAREREKSLEAFYHYRIVQRKEVGF